MAPWGSNADRPPRRRRRPRGSLRSRRSPAPRSTAGDGGPPCRPRPWEPSWAGLWSPRHHVAEDHTVEADVDLLVDAGRHVLADIVGADGKLPVAAVHHHRQLHGPGPAVVAEGV